VDVVLLASRLDAVFVSKAEVKGWPGIGLLCRTAGTVFVDRTSRRDLLRANARIAEYLGSGHGIVLFPEGTSSDGTAVGPFRPSLLALPAERGLPVHCASISYRTPPGWPPAGLAVCWWGDMSFGGHILDLLRLPFFEARLRFRPEAIADADRKRLAAELHSAVSELLVSAGGDGEAQSAASS
jgi:1-acyl-sn-glycerol-3-phosphate acyltransferase